MYIKGQVNGIKDEDLEVFDLSKQFNRCIRLQNKQNKVIYYYDVRCSFKILAIRSILTLQNILL